MQKMVLTLGVISGVPIWLMMVVTVPFEVNLRFLLNR
jgi:hypothetical protein